MPTSCTVTETLNGEWEVAMEHPIDAQGKWQRLDTGCIVRVPVPAAETPRIELVASGASKEICSVNTPTGKSLRLRSGTGTNYKILGSYKVNTKVVVLDKSNASWYEVACPDGKRGYMYASYLAFVRTETTVVGKGMTIEPRQLREQPFRIYRTIPSLSGIKVYARHLFYDLSDNMIRSYKPASTDTGAAVVSQISASCQSEHAFSFFSDLVTTADDVVFENVNPVDAFLKEGGFVEEYGAELARDWHDVFLVNRVGKDTNVMIMEGKNLLGVTYDVDETDVVTRIMPTGEKKNGKLLYLDELYVDSPNIGNYPHPKWCHLAVEDAKISDAMTETQAKDKMRAAALAEFDKGCDMPVVSVSVDFVNAADTEEFSQYHALQSIFLGDTVRVYARRIGLTIAMRMTQYTFNCLTGKYEKVVLGVATEALEGSSITGKQLPNGEIRGSKLAYGSVGAGQLRDGSVGSLQIQSAAIETAHIVDAAITRTKIGSAAIGTAQIDEAAIQTAQIADAAITKAKIGAAAIGSVQIEDAAISRAKIENAAIGAAQIEDASIGSAKIQNGAIHTALIGDAAIDTVQIKDGSITDAKIVGLTANKITAGTIDATNIEVINLKAANITVGTINGQQISSGAIDTQHLIDGSVTGGKIGLGEIAANKLNLTQHTIW